MNVNRIGMSWKMRRCIGSCTCCGLMAVKGIGDTLAARVVEGRGRGYASLEDLMLRTRLNERDLAALLAVSALQSLGRDGFSPEEKRRNWQRYLGFQPSELGAGRKAEGIRQENI